MNNKAIALELVKLAAKLAGPDDGKPRIFPNTDDNGGIPFKKVHAIASKHLTAMLTELKSAGFTKMSSDLARTLDVAITTALQRAAAK